MKTRLLKRLRREAKAEIQIRQMQMRNMGASEYIFRISYGPAGCEIRDRDTAYEMPINLAEITLSTALRS